MKVLLVYPDEIAKNYEVKRPPLGLAYVGAVLKQKHSVKILDMRLKSYNIKKFKQTLKEFKPDIVGFTLMALGGVYAFKLAKIVKKYTSAKVVLGGPEITLFPQGYIDDKLVDFIIRGEGEYSFLDFINFLEDGKSIDKLPGIGYKKKGKVKINPYHAIGELDKLPFPDWSLFDLNDYRPKLIFIKNNIFLFIFSQLRSKR